MSAFQSEDLQNIIAAVREQVKGEVRDMVKAELEARADDAKGIDPLLNAPRTKEEVRRDRFKADRDAYKALQESRRHILSEPRPEPPQPVQRVAEPGRQNAMTLGKRGPDMNPPQPSQVPPALPAAALPTGSTGYVCFRQQVLEAGYPTGEYNHYFFKFVSGSLVASTMINQPNGDPAPATPATYGAEIQTIIVGYWV